MSDIARARGWTARAPDQPVPPDLDPRGPLSLSSFKEPAITTTWTKGDRVVLISTDDHWCGVKPGDTGTVFHWHEPSLNLWVDWDGGTRLAMLPGFDEIEHAPDCTPPAPARRTPRTTATDGSGEL
ncbi:DUF4314 domain-containing protein [Longispora sp. K20-0274]|uniref:DUF4314 domain-containing protein n=1 Tax=Longispora sp. K20-0274 TaxID=3088255 RepID=UPI00399BA7D1